MDFAKSYVLPSPTGAAINVYARRAEGPERGILLIHHGLAEHAGRYGPFAVAMAAHGFHVYAHDHRGHGATAALDAPIGRFADRDGVDRVIADCLAVRDHAALDHPGLPIVVLGHSMGGLIALNFAEAYRECLDALAVWNANFEGRAGTTVALAILAVERMLLGSDVPSRRLPRLTFEAWAKSVDGRRTAFDWLSRNPLEVDAYVADPLCGFAPSVSMWRDVFTLIRIGASAEALRRLPPDLPIHLAGGSRDPATGNGAAVRRLAARMRRLGLRDVTLQIEEGARHETLKDLHAETAIAGFAAWADRSIAGRREG